MKPVCLVVALMMVSESMEAQATAEQIAKCAAIRIAAQRLACFDALSPASSVGPNVPPAPADADATMLGKWLMTKSVDPITDRAGATFLLTAESATTVDHPTLIIRCKQGDLDAFVSPDAYLGSRNTQVTVRFGNDEPLRERWSAASGNAALFYPGNRSKVEAFVRKLATYERLVIEVQPYNKIPRALVFDLTGIDHVLGQLQAVCPFGS